MNFSALRAIVELREDLPLRRAELPPLEEGLNSDVGSGGGIMGNDGTLFSLRSPPRTVGVGVTGSWTSNAVWDMYTSVAFKTHKTKQKNF